MKGPIDPGPDSAGKTVIKDDEGGIIAHQMQINDDASSCDASEPGAFAVVFPRVIPPTAANAHTSGITAPSATRSSSTNTNNQQDLQDETQAETRAMDIPLIDAHLVSDPPKAFEKCQICMAACDDCKGWEACQDVCVSGATFACQNATLCNVKSVQEYADFMALFGRACPDATWTVREVTWDGSLNTAFFHCTYHATHTEEVDGMGPSPPTYKTAHSDYCYIIKTNPDLDGKIIHVQKIWNDHWMLGELGWISDAGTTPEEKSTRKSSAAAVIMKETKVTRKSPGLIRKNLWSCCFACISPRDSPSTTENTDT